MAGLTLPKRGGLLVQVGRLLREFEWDGAALRVFRIGSRVAPGNPDAAFYSGLCREQLGDADAACQEFERALALGPERAKTARRLGHALRRNGRHEPAIRALELAEQLAPGDADTSFHLGLCHESLDQFDAARAHFARGLARGHPDAQAVRHMLAAQPRDRAIPDRFDFVILGTTGTCNASCVHCPTNKLQTANAPRAPMPMPLFRKIIDEIAESGMPVARQLAFGLFGDALLDPHVIERARYARERLPDVPISINTNGGAYDSARHAELNETVSIVALHCESLVPETYEYLMRPLKAARVYPKFPTIFADFPGKVQVAAPLSRMNVDERDSLRTYFEGLGANHVDFATLANRCAHDDTLFDQLAFDPQPIRCEPGIVYNLIVDCDGTVVACCNDFARETPIGNMATDSLEEVLADAARLSMREKLAAGEHESISTCSRCRGDTCAPA